MSHLSACSGSPPSQPLSDSSQSTSCCSDNETNSLFSWKFTPSMLAIVAKLQQDPHWPWSFTSFTPPSLIQSKAVGSSSLSAALGGVWGGISVLRRGLLLRSHLG